MAAPLDGIKVLDLSWVMVGPVSARYLADLGAEVIKVESTSRIDPLRTLPPFKDAQFGLERSLSYHNLNAGKKSLTLDLKDPRGRKVVLRLARWADVVVESFAPRVLADLGLTFETLQRERADLIMVSTSIAGRTGPYANQTRGVGTNGAALAGASFLIGWPDRTPVGPFGPWTDSVAPRFVVPSILAALRRRQQTGQGLFIDVAQSEAGLQFLAPAALEHATNGTIPQRRGPTSPHRVPHGVFPCRGEDRWVAIDASSDRHWQALRGGVGGALSNARYDTLLGRLRARDEIERLIGEWTADREAVQVEIALQELGVPAHVVCRAADLATDPHLEAAGHLRWFEDPNLGRGAIEGPRFELLATGTVQTRRGPGIGEHTAEVLRDVCGYSEEEISEMTSQGVLK